MAGPLHTPLFRLAALTLALALALSPSVGASPSIPRLLGGLMDADVKEEGVQQVLNFALSEYKASSDAFHSRAMRVVRAQKQVVAGMKYILDVEICQITCTKSHPNFASCPSHDQPHLMKKALCSFQIYSVPWISKISMTKPSCQDA